MKTTSLSSSLSFFFCACALTGVGILASGCSGGASGETASSSDQNVTSKPAADVSISKDDDGTTVAVTAGAKVVLTLSQNGSTGYAWMFKSNDLGEPEEHFKRPTQDVPGASGEVTFTWSTAGVTGSHTIELVLQRPWAETSPPIDHFSVSLDVQAAPETCGGFRGAECSDASAYCSFGSMCGADDRTGVCTPRPKFCPALASPVCGCDGKTYTNYCEAAQQGVSIKFHGPCELP